MKITFYIAFAVAVLFLNCTRKNQIENKVVKHKDSLEVFLSLANDFDLPVFKRKEYSQKAIQILNHRENDSVYRSNLVRIANRYFNMEAYDEYKRTVELLERKAIEKNDQFSVARANVYLGDMYTVKEKIDSAFYRYNKAENIFFVLNDKYNIAETIINKATLQYQQGDYLGAELAISKALKVLKDRDDNDLFYLCFNILAQIYNEFEDYDKAIIYHNKALDQIDNKINNSFLQAKATSYNNLGSVYLNKKQFQKAKMFFLKGLAEKNVLQDKPSLSGMLINNLAYSKFKLGESNGLPQLFFKALKIRDSLNLTTGIIASKNTISEYFLVQKDTFKAMKFASESLLLSKKLNNPRGILASLKHLSLADPKNEAIYSQEYIIVSEKLQKAERAIGNKFSRIEYETEEIIEKNDNLTTKNKTLLYGLIALSTISLLLYLIKSQRNRNKILQYKQSQQAANEAIYNLMISQQNTIDEGRIKEKKRVAQELHDGVLGRMFGLRINLDSLNQFEDDNAVQKRTKYLLELQNIEQDIREISHDLNRENQTLINNFVVILNNLLEEQRKTFSIPVQSNISTTINWNTISNSVKINIYRIIQESLQNINKYAKATTIIVRCLQNEEQLVLEIIDDGIGFNTIKAKKGIGLQNILFRANECKGEADIKSAKGQGTTIKVSIPLQSN